MFVGFIAGIWGIVILIQRNSQRNRLFAVLSGLFPVLIGFVGIIVYHPDDSSEHSP